MAKETTRSKKKKNEDEVARLINFKSKAKH